MKATEFKKRITSPKMKCWIGTEDKKPKIPYNHKEQPTWVSYGKVKGEPALTIKGSWDYLRTGWIDVDGIYQNIEEAKRVEKAVKKIFPDCYMLKSRSGLGIHIPFVSEDKNPPFKGAKQNIKIDISEKEKEGREYHDKGYKAPGIELFSDSIHLIVAEPKREIDANKKVWVIESAKEMEDIINKFRAEIGVEKIEVKTYSNDSSESKGKRLFEFEEVWEILCPALQENGYIAGFMGGESAVKTQFLSSWNGKPKGEPNYKTKSEAREILKEKVRQVADTPAGHQNDKASAFLMYASCFVDAGRVFYLNQREWYIEYAKEQKWTVVMGDEGHYLLADKKNPKHITLEEHYQSVAEYFIKCRNNKTIRIKGAKQSVDIAKSIVADWWHSELNKNTRNNVFYTKRHEIIAEMRDRTIFKYKKIENEEGEKEALLEMCKIMDFDEKERGYIFLQSYFRSMATRFMIGGTRATPLLVLHGIQGCGKSRWAMDTSIASYAQIPENAVGDTRETIIGIHKQDGFIGGVAEWAEMIRGRNTSDDSIKTWSEAPYDKAAMKHSNINEAWIRYYITVATTNNSNWQEDITGSRRFMGISTNRTEQDRIDVYRAKDIAQSLHTYYINKLIRTNCVRKAWRGEYQPYAITEPMLDELEAWCTIPTEYLGKNEQYEKQGDVSLALDTILSDTDGQYKKGYLLLNEISDFIVRYMRDSGYTITRDMAQKITPLLIRRGYKKISNTTVKNIHGIQKRTRSLYTNVRGNKGSKYTEGRYGRNILSQPYPLGDGKEGVVTDEEDAWSESKDFKIDENYTIQKVLYAQLTDYTNNDKPCGVKNCLHQATKKLKGGGAICEKHIA